MTLPSISSRSSVDRALARCSGGHGFYSCWGLRIFSLSHTRVMLINSLFTFFENFRRLQKIAEDVRRGPEDVSIIHQRIDSNLISVKSSVLTSENMENTPLESRMWYVVWYEFYEWCIFQVNTRVYIMTYWSRVYVMIRLVDRKG